MVVVVVVVVVIMEVAIIVVVVVAAVVVVAIAVVVVAIIVVQGVLAIVVEVVVAEVTIAVPVVMVVVEIGKLLAQGFKSNYACVSLVGPSLHVAVTSQLSQWQEISRGERMWRSRLALQTTRLHLNTPRPLLWIRSHKHRS